MAHWDMRQDSSHVRYGIASIVAYSHEVRFTPWSRPQNGHGGMSQTC